MFHKFNEFIKRVKLKKRINKILKKCGCCCHCPKCYDILNDMSTFEYIDDHFNEGYYKCALCGNISHWDFSAAPVPILIDKYITKI